MDKRFKEMVETELEKYMDSGLTVSNLEKCYKLVDMLKDLTEIEVNEDKGAYSSYGTSERDERGGRGERGDRGDRTSAAYNRYLASKRDYRYSQTGACKERLMDTLEDYMKSFVSKMEDMLNDAECQEERSTIQRYINKIQNLR